MSKREISKETEEQFDQLYGEVCKVWLKSWRKGPKPAHALRAYLRAHLVACVGHRPDCIIKIVDVLRELESPRRWSRFTRDAEFEAVKELAQQAFSYPDIIRDLPEAGEDVIRQLNSHIREELAELRAR